MHAARASRGLNFEKGDVALKALPNLSYVSTNYFALDPRM
jgi:hypothetical protein